ncbi:phosphoribosyl-ATP diphosphatase [Tepidamorphus sp. 3E244]|uniref:phosphoribosyl-ATP diphosphatase n=1 Tax=Tepidamorphus sp. 3E244 TaxID=3385498 RepID=UPI0038FCE32E
MSDQVDLQRLSEIVAQRAGETGEKSYTASLLAGGPERCAKKFGEEAVEAVIAAVSGDKAALTAEVADVLYHLAVLLHAAGVPLDDVHAELARRTSQSGHAEKASRRKD